SHIRTIAALAAILIGTSVGLTLGNLIDGTHKPWDFAIGWRALGIGLFFGLIGMAYYLQRERAALLEAELKTRELQHLEAERRGLEAQLKMLQAQIEPHFLFNTLANLAGLIEADPKLASRLLEALNRYLRASLQRTRAEGGTLGDEIDLLTAYLDVLKIRLGPRLDYSIAIAAEHRALPFPPMLLQPLVENAIQHGIEPQVAGGRIDITATQQAAGLDIEVRDTGAGFGDEPGNGIGLSNIRARLAALFGEAGHLEIAEHVDGGVLATLRIPT
ncbi:MAG TPA: sensor histidine kinase, partial [Rhodocyclaceae bacterium]|nr:sensor histidine kinase [Rhodocyclaceae bacterium]